MEKIIIEVEDYSKVSDGFHTIEEIYEHRIALYIALAKAQTIIYWEFGGGDDFHAVWRSKVHFDGSAYDGWFLLGIRKEKNKQITYHLPLSHWDETDFADTLEKAPEWDGHTTNDVIGRLKQL